MLPAPHPPRRGVRRAATLNTSQPKRPKDPAASPFTARTAASGRTPAHSVKTEDDISELVSESEELRLLRKENAQLKKLIGELVIRPVNTAKWVPHPFRVLCGKGGRE
jgi:hypothetical protein